jgi:FLVCR family feline leukemia virus subgroup C receptor-related protein
VATLLNEMASQKFPKQNVMIGLLGFVFVLSGLPATVLAGIWLDRTLAYKRGTIFLLSTAFLAMVGFTITLEFAQSIYGLFLVLAVLGFTSTSFLPMGFEFAAEITYPVPEGTSAGILNASAQCFGIFFIVLIGSLVEKAGALVGNLVLSGALLLGVGLLPLVRADLHRRSVDMYGDEIMDSNLPERERCGSSYQQIPMVVSE